MSPVVLVLLALVVIVALMALMALMITFRSAVVVMETVVVKMFV